MGGYDKAGALGCHDWWQGKSYFVYFLSFEISVGVTDRGKSPLISSCKSHKAWHWVTSCSHWGLSPMEAGILFLFLFLFCLFSWLYPVYLLINLIGNYLPKWSWIVMGIYWNMKCKVNFQHFQWHWVNNCYYLVYTAHITKKKVFSVNIS